MNSYSHLLMAIDPGRRYIFIANDPLMSDVAARPCYNALPKAGPTEIAMIQTDGSMVFADWLFGPKDCRLSEMHELNQWCHACGIELCLPNDRMPQTNGLGNTSTSVS